VKILSIPLLLSLSLLGCAGAKPAGLGVKDGRFAPCPSTPNCVSSQSIDPEHAVAPLRFTDSPEDALGRLQKIISSMKRARIVEESGWYLRAEFTSLIFRFVDDVEFYVDADKKLVQVRSASRVGSSDFGVNRKRVDEIRALWNEAGR
jgi:uncharacterized protein (DUF1499 family)